MATQFVNQATSSATIGGQLFNFQSNSVTAEFFDNASVTLLKAQSSDLVVSKGTITYTITITNLSISPITNLTFTDAIPTGLTYDTDSFKVNGTAQTPIIVGQDLSYEFSTLPIGVTLVTFDCTAA